MKDTRISGEGLYNLCTAVIDKAHQDYITGTPNELYYLRQFIRVHSSGCIRLALTMIRML